MSTLTDEQRRRLAQLAGAVALEAPLREGKYSNEARIPWDLINKIRAVLDEAGFDWRKARADVAIDNAKDRKHAMTLAEQLRASLAIEDEIRDTLAAYEYLAEWEAGAHRGGDDDKPILRLCRSHRHPQTQE